MSLTPLPDVLLQPLVEAALREDLGRGGDITTAAIVPSGVNSRAVFNARKEGVVAGLGLARIAFRAIDPDISFTVLKKDGDLVNTGDSLARVEGPAHGILSGERVALNFLCHLSGISTETHKLVEA
ncbi:MAG: nicotinate-nucleotide diphosphorylase (carboxylating), partial [Alphaproteobacteria bacterium]|nr:nicotinate-nucleotide diphosphorylase (carboxylating) [Alphaproteobacteria bacterium]